MGQKNQLQLPQSPSPKINIGQMKKDFKDLILATTSQAIGDGHFGSGSNRDVFTVDKTNTDMD